MYNKLYTKFIACLALLLAMPMTWALASPPDDEPTQPTLQELLDSYTFGPDDYSWGPGPGVISDSTTYADWYNLYSSALQMSSSTTATDEEKAAMVVKLQAMKQKVDAAIKPVTDGVYYIITTYSAFNGKDTMAWFAPREHNFPGWKKLDKNSLKFMWRITKLEDGNYSMQNLATLQYVFHNTTIDGQETNMYMTDDMEYEQVLENIKPNGQFLIHCKGAKWTYNIQKHNSGNATEGPIGNWLDKNLNGEGTWRLQPVTESELAAASATQYHQMLEARVNSFNADSYTLGTDPGNYSQEAMDAVKAEITADTTLLANTESPATEEQCKTAYEKLNTAIAALKASIVPITDGYYSISTVTYQQAMEGNEGLALTVDGDADWLYNFTWQTKNPAFIWKVTPLGNNRYTVQNFVSKKYFNSTDLVATGASINLTKTPTVSQIITSHPGATFSFSNTDVYNLNFGYYADNDLVYLAKGGYRSFYLHKYTDDEANQLAVSYPQKLRNDTLSSLINTAITYTGLDSIYTIDLTSPIVTDASQFYSNNQSQEGSLAAMIDGDFGTFFITNWGTNSVTREAAPHYLRVDAGEGKTLPTSFGMHWHTRGSTWANMYRPIDVTYSVSDDAENWVDVGSDKNPSAGFPVVAEEPEFTSSKPIHTAKPYRYFKLTVNKTNTGANGPDGYPYFTFAEFNIYPMKGTAMDVDPDFKTALENLRTAVSSAQSVLSAGTTTSADIKALQDAYTAFLLQYKDTSDLFAIYKKSTGATDNIEIGEDMFSYPEDKVSEFEEAWNEVDAARPFSSIEKQSEVARLDTLLTRAYTALQNSMVGPDPDVWYNILSADTADVDFQGNTLQGQVCWVGGLSSVDGFATGDHYIQRATDLRTSWRFEPTSTPNVYYMINCASGWPINRGPVLLKPLGEGQCAIYTGTNLDGYFYIMVKNHQTDNPFPGNPAKPGTPDKYNSGAWTLSPTPSDYTHTLAMSKGSNVIVCLPFDTYDMPTSLTDGETVTAYEICGYEVAEDGKTVTHINLTEMAGDEKYAEGIPAGTPFVLSYGDTYDSEVTVTADLKAKVGGNVSRTLSTQNGLYGTFSNVNMTPGMIYLSMDSAYVEKEVAGKDPTVVKPTFGYININAVKNNPEASVDKQIPVAGTIELAVGINSAVSKKAEKVDVYTADGVLLKKGVKAADAEKNLGKGIYIIGKDKKLVK